MSVSVWYHCVCYRYSGSWKMFSDIARREGVRGLWKGWVPNCQRAALVCLGGESCDAWGVWWVSHVMPGVSGG